MHDRCHYYLLPIGGTATAALAGLLHEDGERVSGVDTALYPPTSELLAALGIPVRLGYDPERIRADADRIVIGNALPRSNPEVQAVLARGLPYTSQAGRSATGSAPTAAPSSSPAPTARPRRRRSPPTCSPPGASTPPCWSAANRSAARRGASAGAAGRSSRGTSTTPRSSTGGRSSSTTDPHLFLLGPVEFDHADIYRDLDAVLTAYRAGTAQVPRDGGVIVNGWSPAALSAVRDAAAPVVAVGPGPGADLQLVGVHLEPERSTARLRGAAPRSS